MSEPMEQGLGIPQWTLADRLRKSLDHAGVTGPQMAEYLEVHRNTVSNWIYGHAKPPASAVKLWALRTGVPYEWLAHGIVPGKLTAGGVAGGAGAGAANRSSDTRFSQGQSLGTTEIVALARPREELRRALGHGAAQTNRRAARQS